MIRRENAGSTAVTPFHGVREAVGDPGVHHQLLHGGRVLGHDRKRSRRHKHVGWEEVIDAAVDSPLRNINRRIGWVVELDERIAYHVVRAVVVNFIDYDSARMIDDRKGKALFVRKAGAVRCAQPNVEGRPQPAGKARTGAEHVAVDDKL